MILRLTKRIVLISLVSILARQASAQTSNDLFDGGVLHEIRLEINPKDWTALKENPGSNTYYPCNLRWLGLEIENIGIRQRGGSTRNRTKPGLRVDFNRFEANQEFFGQNPSAWTTWRRMLQ